MTRNRGWLRTPAAAALLSFIFPGLGQVAAGRPRRGAIIAIPAIVATLAFLEMALFDRRRLEELTLNAGWLNALFWLDIVFFVYHAAAVVDAYLVARRGPEVRGPAHPRAGAWSPRSTSTRPMTWVSLVAVAAILTGTVAVHGAVAATDTTLQHTLYCITAPTPCWVTANGATPAPGSTDVADRDVADSLATPDASSSPPRPLETVDLGALPSFTTGASNWTWAANGQFNVLLAGIGVQADPSQLGPDTIMVLHVDRSSGRAALISIGRNNACVPLPQGVAQQFARGQSGCPPYTWPDMINAFPNAILNNCRLSPLYADTCGQANDPNRYLRAYRTFEQVVGGLLGLTIDGSVWINPVGLTRLIDDVGGVTIDIPAAVLDKPCGPAGTWQNKFAYCPYAHSGYWVPTGASGVASMKNAAAASNGQLAVTWTKGGNIAMSIQAGRQHLDGNWALAYARTRIFANGGDFDRAQRQQLVLKALGKGLDPCRFASPGNVVSLLSTLSDVPYAFNTDLPITNPQDLQEWASLAKRVLSGDVHSLVLDPVSTGESQVSIGGLVYPAVDARSWTKIKSLVASTLAPPSADASPSASGTAARSTGC